MYWTFLCRSVKSMLREMESNKRVVKAGFQQLNGEKPLDRAGEWV